MVKTSVVNLNNPNILTVNNDTTIGEDTTDYLTVNSETRFLSDVNIGGSSIKLHSSGDDESSNFIEIKGQKIHSTDATILGTIKDTVTNSENEGKILKIGNSNNIIAGDGGGGGGSGIINNRIDGDLTIGEDSTDLLVINSDTKFTDKLTVSGDTNISGNLSLTNDLTTKLVTVGNKNILMENEIKSISCGAAHTAILTEDGKVFTFGRNLEGQLGINSETQQDLPMEISGNHTDIIAVSCGGRHTAILKNNGTVFTFGENSNTDFGSLNITGQLGRSGNNKIPMEISGNHTDIIAVSCGSSHTAILKSNGTVFTFGMNIYGRLGRDVIDDNNDIPMEISGNHTNIIAVSCGGFHTAILNNDGKVLTFGRNDEGQLGHGNSGGYDSEPAVIPNLTNCIAVSCGSKHTAILKNDGTVFTFGRNNYGQLGDGTDISRSSPTLIVNHNDIIAVSCGYEHTAILKNNGTVFTFGRHLEGQLGHGEINDNVLTPIEIEGHTDIIAVSCGNFHTAILKNNGTVFTFGYNYNRQLGLGGITTNALIPTEISTSSPSQYSGNIRTLFNKLEFTNNMTISNNNFSINETLNDNITTLNKSSLDIQKLYPQSSINFKDTSGTSNLFIDHKGNVGIGTSIPSKKLEVDGNVKINNNLNVIGDFDIQGQGNIKGDVVIGEDSTDLMIVNSNTEFTDNIKVSNSITTKNAIVSDNMKGTDISYGSSWSKLGNDIYGEAELDNSGYSVSLSSDGTIVAIGAPFNDGGGANSGHVRVYKYDGTSWNKLGNNIDGEYEGDLSGHSVSLSSNGTIVAIGAHYNDGGGDKSGHVRVYEYDGTSWEKLGNDIDGESADDESGYSVSLSSDGTIVAIGAWYNDGGGFDSGHVKVYEYNGTSWIQVGNDIDGEYEEDYSGRSVSLSADGTIVAIGAHFNDGNGHNSGHVRVYEYDGTSWDKLGNDIDGESADDLSGYSVSLSVDGTIVAIGAHYNDGGGDSSGHVRVYKYDGTSWNKLGNNIDGEYEGDLSGHSVSLSSNGTIVAIGAHYNDGGGDKSGHVRVYEYDGTSWEKLGNDIDGESADDESGYSVSLSSDGTIVAIGAPFNDDGGDQYHFLNQSGHVRVYKIDKITNLNVDGNLIVSNGNVGIGTTDPKTNLHVKSTGNEGKIIIENEILALLQLVQPISTGHKTYNIELGRTDGDLTFRSTSGERMRITEDGNVGIGTTNPQALLEIYSSSLPIFGGKNQNQTLPNPLKGLKLSSYNIDWNIFINNNDDLIFAHGPHHQTSSLAVSGYISDQYNDAFMNPLNFTGQHRCILNKNIDENSVGLIVSSNGKYININNSLNTNISESLPICSITSIDNDTKVFGVISDKEDTNSNRTYESGAFVTPYEKTNRNEQRMFINSLGEGAVWVCNKNDVLVNGDYISSSSVSGYGMKQTLNEEFLTRYTVAKITCDCDFSLTKIVKQKLKVISQTDSNGNAYIDIDYDENGDVQYEDDLDADGNQQMIYPFETRFLQADATQITEEEYNTKLAAEEEVYIACFVGCTYHCG